MTILYINDEHCTSMEQLRSYFEDSISYDSPLFYDLLDYARSGDLSSWFREKGESSLADKVDSIDGKLGDSEYFSCLSALMTGNEATPDLQKYEKPAFSKCFKVEDVRQEEIPTGIAVHVHLKVLSSVNETYELGIRTSWGQRGDTINPFNETKDRTLTKSFIFRKRPNQDFKIIKLLADGIELEDVPYASLEGDVLEFEVDSCRFKMIRVEHGLFMMGATTEMNTTLAQELPVHIVSLSKDYYIGETQVTQNLWNAVMGNNPSYRNGLVGLSNIAACSFIAASSIIADKLRTNGLLEEIYNLPVENVSWNDCQEFIKKLNIITGRSFRLPTEAEWEFAARGGNKSKGFQYSGSNAANKVAWHRNNSSHSQPVKKKQANELGIFDMSGNVEEWCQDWYGDYIAGPQLDPTGPERGDQRVCRGGGFTGCAEMGRSSYRRYQYPDSRNISTGFRLVLSS